MIKYSARCDLFWASQYCILSLYN